MGEIDLDVLQIVNTKQRAIDLCLVLIEAYGISIKELIFHLTLENDRRKALDDKTPRV